MLNVTGIISNESNQEIKEHLESISSIIGPDGSLTIGGSTDLIDLTFQNMTKISN